MTDWALRHPAFHKNGYFSPAIVKVPDDDSKFDVGILFSLASAVTLSANLTFSFSTLDYGNLISPSAAQVMREDYFWKDHRFVPENCYYRVSTAGAGSCTCPDHQKGMFLPSRTEELGSLGSPRLHTLPFLSVFKEPVQTYYFSKVVPTEVFYLSKGLL